MTRLACRLLALGLGAGLSIGVSWGAARAFPDSRWGIGWRFMLPDERMQAQERLTRDAQTRAEAIAAEAGALDRHPWAGRYVEWVAREGDPGQQSVLCLAPRAGFTHFRDSWCGTCTGYSAMGRVVEQGPGRLSLEPEVALGNASFEESGLTTVHLFEWGDFRFAVTEPRVESFCERVLYGGDCFLAYCLRLRGEPSADGRESRPPGRPLLPQRLRALVPERPIESHIVALVRPGVRPPRDTDGTEVRALLRLDRGSDHGLAVGLSMTVDGAHLRGRVEFVARDSAELSLWTDEGDDSGGAVLVGRRASTP